MSEKEKLKLISNMINRETPLLEIQQCMKERKKDIYTSRELAEDLEKNFAGGEKESERDIEERFQERMIRIDQISAELEDLDKESRDSDFES